MQEGRGQLEAGQGTAAKVGAVVVKAAEAVVVAMGMVAAGETAAAAAVAVAAGRRCAVDAAAAAASRTRSTWGIPPSPRLQPGEETRSSTAGPSHPAVGSPLPSKANMQRAAARNVVSTTTTAAEYGVQGLGPAGP